MTVPAAGAATLAESVAGAARVVDVIYDPWPTPLAAAVTAAGITAGDIVLEPSAGTGLLAVLAEIAVMRQRRVVGVLVDFT